MHSRAHNETRRGTFTVPTDRAGLRVQHRVDPCHADGLGADQSQCACEGQVRRRSASERQRDAELCQRRDRLGRARDWPVHRAHLVIDPRVKGAISLVTERPVTKQQAFEQLLSALRLRFHNRADRQCHARGPRGRCQAAGRRRVVVPHSPLTPRETSFVTQVFRLQYESATAMVPVLRPLIAPNNTISAYPQNNTLVITDYAENLRRIQRIIESIDTPGNLGRRDDPGEIRPGNGDRQRRRPQCSMRVPGRRRTGRRRRTAHLGAHQPAHQHADRACTQPGAHDAC